MSDSLQLPPKPEVALALLQTAISVYVHLDPRQEGVLVPSWFKKQPQLVLQIGMNMSVPIPDLDVGEEAISCTLSFNRRPEFCRIPWTAIFGLVGDDGRGMIWPESIPPEVAAAAEGRPTAPPKERALRVVGKEPVEKDAAEKEAAPEKPLEPVALTVARVSLSEVPAPPAPKAEPKESPTPSASTPPVSTPPVSTPPASTPPAKRELPAYLRVVK